MNKKRIQNGIVLLMAAALLGGCSPEANQNKVVVNLDFHSYENAEEMFEAADAVLVGTVTAVRDERLDTSLSEEPLIYPYHIYTLHVCQVIKGNVGSEYEIKVLGGEMDHVIYDVGSGDVEMEVGNTYLIATEEYYEYDTDSYPSLLNYEQAWVPCEPDSSEITIINENIHISEAIQQYGAESAE